MKRLAISLLAAVAGLLSVSTAASAGQGGGQFALDVVVIGGSATTSDFSHDLLLGAPQVTGIVDPSAALCDVQALGPNCSTPVFRNAGEYTVSPNTIPASYVQTGFSCSADNDGTVIDVTRGTSSFELRNFTPTLCTITYTYATQQIAVDLTVINDDGGTATAADFTIELRDSSDTVIQSGVDPEPGTGNASLVFTVPLGEYSITVSGPGEYVITVNETTVARDADLAVVASFTVTQSQTVNAQIVANDPSTTTTSTTTSTTTTTVAPATTVPTTPPTTNPVAELPATGSTDSSLPLALVAAALVALGAGAVAITRRR